MIRTLTTITAAEAPAAISCVAANCAAPDKKNTERASDSGAERPVPVAVVPQTTAKGIRPSKTGTAALAPEAKADKEDALFGLSSEATSLRECSGLRRRPPLLGLLMVVTICDSSG